MNDLGLGKLATNAAGTLTRQVVVGFLQLATIVIIARLFGPEGNGIYAVALLLPSMLATFLNLGIGSANVYYLGSKQFSLRKVRRSCVKISITLSMLGIVIGSLIIQFKADVFFPEVDRSILWLALLSFPVSLILGFISSIFQGIQKFKEFNIALLVQPVVMLTGVIGLAVFESVNLYNLLLIHIAGGLLSLLFSGICLHKYVRADEGRSIEKNYSKPALSYGYKAHLSNVMAFVNYKADIFLVSFFLNPASAGIYVIAVQLTERLWIVSQAVSTVLLPRLSELSEESDKRLQITPLISRLTLYSTALLSIGFAAIVYPLVKYIFGMSYIDAYLPLLILLPGVVLASAARILANDFAAQGRPELNLYASIFVVTCNIIGNVFLIPMYGLAGAAMATSIAYTINFLIKLELYRHITSCEIMKLVVYRKDELVRMFIFFRSMIKNHI